MQLEVYFENVNEIVKALGMEQYVEHMHSIYDNMGTNNAIHSSFKQKLTQYVLTVRDRLAVSALSADFQRVLKSLDLETAIDPKTAADLIVGANNYSATADYHKEHSLRLFYSLYIRFINVIKLRDSIEELIILPRSSTDSTPGSEIVEFELLEDKGGDIQAERLILVLKKLSTTVESLNEIGGQGRTSPRIAYLDSGSNTIIGIKIDGSIVKEIKLLFLEVWDRIKFHKEVDSLKKLEVVDESLSVLKLIKELEEKGALDREAASRLRHQIGDSITDLYNNGLVLRVPEERIYINKRQEMIEYINRRLITSGPAADVPQPKVIDTEK